MAKIKFIKYHQVQAEGGAEHNIGDVLECSDESAQHFIRRGKAVLFEDEKKPARGKKSDDAE